MSCDFTSIYDKRNNIYELQTMLRKIARKSRNIRLINPDGIYGDETKEVVYEIQRIANINSTGKVDFLTWNTIVNMSKK